MTKGACRLSTAATGLLSLLLATAAAGAATGGNDFYQVVVEETPGGVGVGVYTVTTGLGHPVTGALGPQSVLFGGGIPGTSYTTIRSYTSGTDYTQRAALILTGAAPPTFVLEQFVQPGEEAVPVGDPNDPEGFVTTYRPGLAAQAPDDLTIVQTAMVVGATFNTSAVKIETAVTNNGTTSVQIGIRYLWDFQIGSGDDGPTYQEKDPDGAVQVFEVNRLVPAFDTYEITDNNDPFGCFTGGNSPFPFFSVQGSVLGPAALSPTPPSRLTYLAWPLISGLPDRFGGLTPALNAFDYTPTGVDVAICDISLDDSGLAYWWGELPGNALSVAPGATVSVAAYIFSYLPGAPPDFTPPGEEGPPGDPTCEDGIDNDGDDLVDLDDPDCQEPPDEEGPPGDPTCEDGIDNDGDDLIDLDDPDCQEEEPSGCLTRTQGFYGSSKKGGIILNTNASLSLGLAAGDPLLGIFTTGTFVPIDLGDGAFVFGDVTSIKGARSRGANDGGFLPGQRKKGNRMGAENVLPNQALTLALTTGLSILGADSLSDMDLDGDGVPDDLYYATGFPGLIVDNPGGLGDGMTVEEVLLAADAALAGGAGYVKRGPRLLSDFMTLPPGWPADASVGDLIRLLDRINNACKLPGEPLSGFLVAP